MKLCERIMCQRKAMEMTQAELAKIVGFDEDVISRFESGEEVPEHVFKSIRGRLQDYIGRLSLERRMQISIISHAFSLSYQESYEKRNTINYITRDVGKLGIELYKPEIRREDL